MDTIQLILFISFNSLVLIVLIHQLESKMTAQFDTLSAAVTQLETQNAALIAIANQLFAGSSGLTAAEVTTLAQRLQALTTADAAAVAADTPAP